MNSINHIRYVCQNDVDTQKWDNLIGKAENGLIYAYSWYLDRICSKWDALIFGDYEYCMPLTYNKKWGFRYLYQPTFGQQLGIFPSPIPEIQKLFISKVRERFMFAEINLNTKTLSKEFISGISEKQNYVLDLSNDYNEKKQDFSSHTKRHIKKSLKNNLNLAVGVDIDEYISFKNNNQPNKKFKKASGNLRQILSYTLSKGISKIFGVYNSENQLCAAAVFVFTSKRATYLNAVSSKKGRELDAMYFLINSFLKEYSGNNLLLDFEGSMIPGIARFYNGFGAKPENYYHYHYNNLPLPLRWIKK